MGRRRLSRPGIGCPTRTMHAAWLLLPVLFALVSCVFAASAQAYTYVLRPDSTTQTNNWQLNGASTMDEALHDALLQPTVPDTSSGYAYYFYNGASTGEVGFSSLTLRGGETV